MGDPVRNVLALPLLVVLLSGFVGGGPRPRDPTGHGTTSQALQRLTSVNIDSAGNVWVTNNWKHIPIPENPGGDGLVVFVGLAPPVKTPLIGPPRQP